MPNLLSAAEIEAFHRDGQLTPTWRLPAAKLARIRALIEGLIEDNPHMRPEQLVGAHIARAADSTVRGRPELFNYITDPDLLDIIEQLIGPDIVMWGSQVFSKPAGDGQAIPWHQDGQYWPMEPLATVTAWIAVDAATVSNGCLRVVPGTHRRGLLDHAVSANEALALNQGLVEGAFDESLARDVELEPGQISLHDCMLVHGSNANTSGARRCGWAIRYMPATSHFRRLTEPTQIAHNQSIDFATRPIWLVRGQDRANNDFTAGHALAEA